MALRFPSLDYLAGQAWKSLLRFPLTILSALVGVVIALYLVETEDQTFNRFPYVNAMLCAALGISLYFCVALLAARQQFSLLKKGIAQLMATLLLLGIYFSLPDADSTHNISLPYIRFGLYAIIVHLLVSFVPFLFTHQLNGFWNYNKALFLRFLSALIYSAFLYVGLVLALFALKVLFEVKIPDELFFELFVVIIGLFNTWFFVAGVPLDFDELEHITHYPKGLKIFSQYVLLPLLALYLLILYGYGIKIILSWNWPEGIVSYLIMVVSVLGILTLLLIYPYARQAENQWIRKLNKAYYFLLLPLLVLLFLAIGMRLSDYGFTVNRYIILVIGIWLTIVCIYFLSGKDNIKFVPVSLALLLLFISFGPWSIFTVSEKSQTSRLEAVLTNAALLREGKVWEEVRWVPDSLPEFYSPHKNHHDGLLSDSLHNEVYSILDYLDDYHGFNAIQPWYAQPLDSLIMIAEADTSRSRWNRVSEALVYMESLGLPYEYKSQSDYGNYFSFSSTTNGLLDVRNYDRLLYLGELYYQREPYPGPEKGQPTMHSTEIGGMTYTIAYTPGPSGLLRISSPGDTVYFSLGQRIGQLTSRYPHENKHNMPPESMYLDTIHQKKNYRLVIENLSFRQKNDSIMLENATGKLLIRD